MRHMSKPQGPARGQRRTRVMDALGLRGRQVRLRSKISGREGIVCPDDPHVFVDGQGVTGWYRRSDLERDFIMLDDGRAGEPDASREAAKC